MAFQVGSTTGSYEMLEPLPSAGRGQRCKVRNRLTQRLEVLKVLPQELRDDAEGLQRFMREAQVHAQLSHPNIAAFYNAMELEGELVITSEWVEGVTLKELLENGALRLDLAVAYAGQVLSALDHSHSRGVIHRNLTPSNILITPTGALKITGFELAKASMDTLLTIPGTLLGDIGYSPPEQLQGRRAPDPRADLYSVGVVLYEMVTGLKLFEAKNAFAVMEAHLTEAPRPPTQLRPDLPASTEAVILRALRKDPSERYQSAAEFGRELRASMRPDGLAPAPQPAARDLQPSASHSIPTNGGAAHRHQPIATGSPDQRESRRANSVPSPKRRQTAKQGKANQHGGAQQVTQIAIVALLLVCLAALVTITLNP